MDNTNKNLSYSTDQSNNQIQSHRPFTATSQGRVCLECGNDHSFRNNFAAVITSIDLIPELLYSIEVKEVIS